MSTVDQASDKTPYVGQTVLWHQDADPKAHPRVAKVTFVHGGGRVDLIAWSRAGGDSISYKNVRHIDDPYLKEFAVQARRTGGWDYTEGDRGAR